MGSTRCAGFGQVRIALLVVLTFVLGTVVGVPAVAAASSSTGPGVLEVRTTGTSLAFGGRSFGSVGQYLQVRGTIAGAVDPTDPRNSPIADLAYAPRNGDGLVEYEVDFVLLRPADLSRGNHKVVYEPTNRGSIVSLFFLNSAPPTNDPSGFLGAGSGFLMRQGYSIFSIAWDPTAPADRKSLLATYPVAKNPDGSSIVGPALEEITYDNNRTRTHPLTYPASTLDKSRATLTVRLLYGDPPVVVPAADWEYDQRGAGIRLARGQAFAQSKLYEFTYLAKDPAVVGLAFAAVRDVADFLRNATTDQAGNPNPLAGQARQVYAFCYSQPCRLMHDFVRLGFNQAAGGGRAVDGIEGLVAGASGGFFNYRFAQPGRTMRQHIGRWYPERQFPFANQVTTDPVTGLTDGVLRRCTISDTCPKMFEINSETEYWNKAASLLTTDTLGNDLDLAATPDVRYYLLTGLSHAAEVGTGICQQPQNPLMPDPVARALLVALDEWVVGGVEPPANRVPRRADGSLVPALPQAGVGFPTIPNVTYTGRVTTGDQFDFGSQSTQGILAVPPVITAGAYPVFVPRTDADGNGVAGVRLPDIAVPLATYSGWNVRAPGYSADDMCNASGQRIPFPATVRERLATGDPRMSVRERYPTHAGYVLKVTVAARALAADRLLLREDVLRYVAEAIVRPVGR